MSVLTSIKKLKPTLGFTLSVGFLNALLNIQYPASDLPLRELFKLSPEILGILLTIWAAAILRIRFRAVCISLTAMVIFMRLFRIGDIMVPMYFFRPFNLYLDSRFLPDLIYLLYTTLSRGAFVFWIFMAVILLIGITWLVWFSFNTIHNYLSPPCIRSWTLGVVMTGLMVLPYISAGTPFYPNPFYARGFLGRVVEELDFILQVKGHRAKHMAVIGSALKMSKKTASNLDNLHGADIYLFFVESYGHSIFADERLFPKIKPDLLAIEKSLKNRGFDIVSNFLNSPTYGGSSWLAHATFASGVHLDNQMRYNLLITSRVKTLVHYFNKAKYRTIRAMPGTQWPWPEGEFYGYQAKYYAWHFDYRGPMFGWSTMPDQYVLEFIRRREMKTSSQPLFIEFILGSSHAPFHQQPPYLQDWAMIGNGAIYHDTEAITFPILWPDLNNASEAYATAIMYDLKVITDFIKQYVNDNALVIILGDHQPNVQLTGENQPWSVPIHVICRETHLLEPFIKRGYTSGFIPTQPPPHRGMETFLYDFLADFSTPPEDAAVRGRLQSPELSARN